jgi:hypothetical protein
LREINLEKSFFCIWLWYILKNANCNEEAHHGNSPVNEIFSDEENMMSNG